MFERYTEKARRVIFHARYEASAVGSPLIESEFLLLGILREDPYAVTLCLGGENVIASLREEIAMSFPKRESISTSVDLPLSDEAKRVLQYAAEESERVAYPHRGVGRYIGVEHLFLALLHERKSRVGRLLQSRGVDLKTLRAIITKELLPDTSFRPSLGAVTTMKVFPNTPLASPQQMPQAIIVVEESGESIQIAWPTRLPVVGDALSLDRGTEGTIAYQVIGVEWTVAAGTAEPPALSRVQIQVRERHKNT